jgi:hypothetical protein
MVDGLSQSAQLVVGCASVLITVSLVSAVGVLTQRIRELDKARHEVELARRDADTEGLRTQLAEYARKLDSQLKRVDAENVNIVPDNSAKLLSTDDKQEIMTTADEVVRLTEALPAMPLVNATAADTLKDVGLAYVLNRQWDRAAEQLEAYSNSSPLDWKANYQRGVAYANSRRGELANLKAIEAFSSALASLPHEENEIKARLLSYRAGMLKRLEKYDLSECDLELAQRYAKGEIELDDIAYNLACIHAMKGHRVQMLAELGKIRNIGRYGEFVRTHLKDYFAEFRDDSELMALIGQKKNKLVDAYA